MFPALIVPTRLAGLWLCGYPLAAILQIFGVMALVCLGLHRVFVQPHVESSAPVLEEAAGKRRRQAPKAIRPVLRF